VDLTTLLAGRGAAGAAPFDPASISGLTLWLKADAIAGLSDGDPVGTWADASGNGNDAVQATESFKPTYKINLVNGLPVVRFDGVDDLLTTPALNLGTRSYVVVAKKNGAAGGSYHGVLQQGGPIYYQLYAQTNWSMYLGGVHDFGVTFDEAFQAVVMTCADGAGNLQLRKNGVAGTSGTGSSTTENTPLSVGRFGSNVLNGDLAEVLVYDSVLSSGDINDLESYLTSKYGL
jgi:hypothetical protein